MCNGHHLNRRAVVYGLGAVLLTPRMGFSDTKDVDVLGGRIRIDGQTAPVAASAIKAQKFTLTTANQGGVIKAKDQIFSLDPETEAEFFRDDDGLVGNIVLKAGGVLSLFGPSSGQGVEITTFNAVGAIRGTTTYFAWQSAERRTYVCCCYGGVDVSNNRGGGQALNTRYHTAIILPEDGGVAGAPYDKPLHHYDDDIIALEAKAGRQPRWQLPNGQLNFFAPQPVPL